MTIQFDVDKIQTEINLKIAELTQGLEKEYTTKEIENMVTLLWKGAMIATEAVTENLRSD